MQVVLESSNAPDHADENVECCSIDASKGAVGNFSNVFCLNASPVLHGCVQGDGAVNGHDAHMAMC
jgi:hypothetical protein